MKQALGIKFLAILFLTTCVVLNGCSSLTRKTALENENSNNTAQLVSPDIPNSRGYLANGATIKVETETDGSETTIIEQFEKTSLELKRTKERLSSLENEFKKLKVSEQELQVALEAGNAKLEIAQLLLIENERLDKENERLKTSMPSLQEQIKQLSEKLLEAQISEIKIKQELVNTRIQLLQEQKKLTKKNRTVQRQEYP